MEIGETREPDYTIINRLVTNREFQMKPIQEWKNM